MQAHERIIIALDVNDLGRARDLAVQLRGKVGAFKIGKQLFTRCGPAAVEMIRSLGEAVFLDLKFHDIPTTVGRACIEATRLGVRMLTLHTLGGAAMLQEAVKAVHRCAAAEGCNRPLLLGVTVLTSMREQDLHQIGIDLSLEELVLRLARSGKEAGLDGVVASPREAELIKRECGSGFLVVTPGIRPETAALHDQQRTLTPAKAVQAGADYLVVGRPVTEAPQPRLAVEAIVAELKGLEG